MKNLTNTIAQNFNTEFEMTAKLVTIENNIDNVLSNENNTWYACLLTTKGIKKNSWRAQH